MPRCAADPVAFCNDSTSVGAVGALALLLALPPLETLTQGCAIPHHLSYPLAVDGLAQGELARRCRRWRCFVARCWPHCIGCPRGFTTHWRDPVSISCLEDVLDDHAKCQGALPETGSPLSSFFLVAMPSV